VFKVVSTLREHSFIHSSLFAQKFRHNTTKSKRTELVHTINAESAGQADSQSDWLNPMVAGHWVLNVRWYRLH